MLFLRAKWLQTRFRRILPTPFKETGGSVSAFLGPIHYIMFERIQIVAARAQFVREFAEERMAPSQKTAFAAQLEAFWKLPEDGDLETQIGDTPIHAWLQLSMENVIMAESALFAVLCDRLC